MIRLADHIRWRAAWMRTILTCSLGLVTIAITACGELEPMIEPEVEDLQLTVDTLKTQVRDSQRALTELRTELESRRQEIADAQVARAQLEGRVREAERRVAEARHVIDLQREELVAARTERERISRSSLQLHSQLKQMQKHLSKFGMSGNQETAPASYEGSGRKTRKSAVASMPPDAPVVGSQAAPELFVTPAELIEASSTEGAYEDRHAQGASVRAVTIKPGDTLWSISRRYRVDLSQLRSMNHLANNKIVAGQAIWVPADRSVREPMLDNSEMRP